MKQLMLKIETIAQSSSEKKKKRISRSTLFLNSHKLAFIEEC